MSLKSRRRRSAEFNAQIVAACAEPGATVAAVARAFGLNDNPIHDWGTVAAAQRFQEHQNIAPRIAAGVCCAVSAFIATVPIVDGRSRGSPSRVQTSGDRRKREVARLGCRRLCSMAS